MIRISILVTILFITTSTFAQVSDKKYPIDIELEACLAIDSNQTTLGMMECHGKARDKWDVEMNKYYTMIMGKLNTEEKGKLKSAQVSWLSFRDKENEFSNTMYYNMKGTMWRIVAVSRALEIVKQRTLELKQYYEIYVGEKH